MSGDTGAHRAGGRVTSVVAIVSAALLLRCKLNSAWLVRGGVLVGLVASALAANP